MCIVDGETDLDSTGPKGGRWHINILFTFPQYNHSTTLSQLRTGVQKSSTQECET
jgi:hypothetical protein